MPIDYTQDYDIKVHEEGAIKLICKAFQSHESGLPEWLKNSADAYIRENTPPSKRVIVVIFSNGGRQRPASISCLDFIGMTSATIEENFRIWADPEAATRGIKDSSLQGGHGNGGKCYMTQMFEDYAEICTIKNQKKNRYGVNADSIRFGYIPDRQFGRDFAIRDLMSELENALKTVGCSLKKLPLSVQQTAKSAEGFSLISGFGPKGYNNRIPFEKLISNLQDHPQMIQTLDLCKVIVIVNGEPFNKGEQIKLTPIPPMIGAETPRIIEIPPSLVDPISSENILTRSSNSLSKGKLTLKTSDVSMRWSRKARHNVVYKADSGFIGYISISELDIQSSYRDRIYGECFLSALEPYKQNERARLANSPLTRAVERFISFEIEKYAKEFEARDRKRYNQEEKDSISKINEALDKWKNKFITELFQGMWGKGESVERGSHEPSLPIGKPIRIEVTLTHPRAGIGVSFQPTLKFFDELGRQIRRIPFRWTSEDNNIAMVDDDLMIINTFSYGNTYISAETLDGQIRSNKVPLEVVQIHDIRIMPNSITLATGSRQKLEAVCRLANGEETSAVYLVWTESNPNIARVSSSGLVFGFNPGETPVVAGDDRILASKPSVITVITGEGRDRGSQRGKGFPMVLVSGEIDTDPETHDYVNLSREDPPVYQRPQDVDRNIWWINSSAPLARLYLDSSKDYGYNSREWRMYHLERYIDVIVQIVLTQGPTEKESISVNDWIMKWGMHAAEIQAAASSDLSDFLANGALPQG